MKKLAIVVMAIVIIVSIYSCCSHQESVSSANYYKLKSQTAQDKEQEEKEETSDNSTTTNNNTTNNSTSSVEDTKQKFVEMVAETFKGLAYKVYFNSKNEFIVEVYTGEWDRLTKNEQKDILILLSQYVTTLKNELGESNVCDYGAIFSQAGRQLESF